ncbi:hypothetical protein D187_001593 [Cystobacter fuscus DSM 2262]|uniref:Uncharacterized protein n=2 Tax=Cystobacter fuscus TaxID=43 RepID=S9PCW4_CYSF2|nr:hypothetical protein D187_001593 [Cystobacter fuscus DSM 2262]
MEELMLLKKKYGLSMQAWAHRARDLGIIGDAAYKRLWEQFDANGWREQEPVAFIGSEEPVRLKLLTLRALAEGVITPIRAEELCSGCTGDTARVDSTIPRLSVRELRKQPPEMREEALRQSVVAVEADYRNDADLTAFEAFGEHDFHVDS